MRYVDPESAAGPDGTTGGMNADARGDAHDAHAGAQSGFGAPQRWQYIERLGGIVRQVERAPQRAATRKGTSCAPTTPAFRVRCTEPLERGRVSARLVRVNTEPESAPAGEHLDENGVDRTLIRACLRQTPLECLEALEEMLQLGESVTWIEETATVDAAFDVPIGRLHASREF
jgi:hypothetical protein